MITTYLKSFRPVQPKPGRPAHAQRGVRSVGDATPGSLTGLVPPEPATPPPKKNKKSKITDNVFSPYTSGIINFSTTLPVHLQASPSRPKKKEGPGKKKKKAENNNNSDSEDEDETSSNIRLNRIKHDPESGMDYLDRIGLRIFVGGEIIFLDHIQ